MVAGQKLEAPKYHMYYGFVAIIAIATMYSYRQYEFMRERLYLWYGLFGLFVMGLGIRAVLVGRT
jgi:cadmium resistance protein CadD (predicted permease)